MPTPTTPLRVWRQRRGISQAAAARLLQTPQRTVEEWDLGTRRPPACLPLLLAYIDAYGPLMEPPEDHGSAPATSAPHAA